MAWFLIGYLSLVRRIKAGTLWKNSLIRTVLKWIGKCSGKLADFARAFSRNTAEKIKVLLVGGAFLFLQFLIIGCVFSGAGVFLLALMAVDVAVMIFAIRKADGQDRIMDGLKKISDGELQYKIKTDTLTGKQKVMAEYINNIGSGLDAAVENSLKKERMQTELITNVSHDLKTPLTSIINYVDLLKRENLTDPKVQEYLRILDEKSQRLKVLTEDVVEASKASTGNIKLEMNDIDFVEMVQQVIGEFEEKFQEKNLTMMVHFTDEPSIIYADGQRMWRVLENVFGNVVKYAMEGTRVYAEISNRNKKVTFSLKNISAQPLNISADELTERFIRGDVARNTEGSGLGLSIAHNYARMMDGDITVQSTEGEGTVFTVTVKLDFDRRKKERKEKTEDISFAGKRILLVEDHPLNVIVAKGLLEKKQFEVVTAENGRKAVELVENFPEYYFDAVLMDIRMPVLDGIGAARELRALDREDVKDLPIIAMTANAGEEDRKQTREAGMNEHLAKPIDPKLLYATLQKFILS